MVGKIYELKNRLLEQIEKDVAERGVERMDGEMVDMVKDLAKAEKDCWEAEYYRAVTEAMGGQNAAQGYMPEGMAYGYASGQNGGSQGAQGRSGWQNQYGSGYSRRGYGSMGHTEAVEGIRNIMSMASPDEKERLKAELKPMLGM